MNDVEKWYKMLIKRESISTRGLKATIIYKLTEKLIANNICFTDDILRSELSIAGKGIIYAKHRPQMSKCS
jgi:hypothetical protein